MDASHSSGGPPLDVVMVASEMRPYATTGGLSEVVRSLPLALGRLGHRVTVILPLYRRALRALPAPAARERALEVELAVGPVPHRARFWTTAESDEVSVVLVDVPELFDRDELYGSAGDDFADNAIRFAALSRAALDYLRLTGRRPSVIHAHDWQAGLVPAYQKVLFPEDPFVGGVPAVFTIHNLAFQGVFPSSVAGEVGLPPDVVHLEGMEFHGCVSYLKAGINFSDRMTTVSPTYAREILQPPSGCGFDGVLSRRAADLHGILNGIDTDVWDPAGDPFLPARYSPADFGGKRAAKRAVLDAFGLDTSVEGLARPLIGLVSRLTEQKGFDLLGRAMESLLAHDAAWVMLGSGERKYEQEWMALAAAHSGRVGTRIGYDERLEHLITAGADAFLMPSRFEPCGLNQLNSMRYGTLPIVHATGGLRDTVQDPAGGAPGTGFVFANFTTDALIEAVGRALDTFREHPEPWQAMQQAAMAKDFSWDVSAREYVKVYRANP